MRSGRRFFCGILVGVFAAAPAFAQPTVADVPFALIDNRVFAPALLNGKGPFHMLLDTGADTGGISLATMQAIGAKANGREDIGGAGEKTDAVLKTQIDRLQIGGAVFRDLPMMAQNFGALNDVIGFRTFDGIAGQAIFRRYTVDIDFAASRLKLIEPGAYRAPPDAVAIPFATYDGFMPLVDGTVGGVRGKFVVDLGDRSSLTVFGPFWRAHGLDKTLGPGIDALTGYGIGGPIRGLVVRVPRFGFGGAVAQGVVARLSLQKSGGFADPAIAGSIGTGVLKHFHTVIDTAHHRFLLVPGPQSADRFDRAGLWLGRHGAQFEVFDVIAGGPGAVAGLHVGDVVTAVDGKPTASLDLFALRERLRDPAVQAPVRLAFARDGKAMQATLRLRDLLPRG